MDIITFDPSGTQGTYDDGRDTFTFKVVKRWFTNYSNTGAQQDVQYHVVNVYRQGIFVNYGNIGSVVDQEDVIDEVERIVEWVRTPSHMLEGIGSRFD
jgi:hypothetical protein